MNIMAEPQSDSSTMNKKICNLLSKQKVLLKDIEHYTQIERRRLSEIINKRLDKLEGIANDQFLEKIENILPADAKHGLWEYNHFIITEAISEFMEKNGVMPTRQHIAEQTGLSRQTVAKHFNEYKQRDGFKAQTEQFNFLSHKMLANVFKAGSRGDMRAARLYFEMIGALGKAQSNTVVNEQNNYIQINNTILSQENLKRLSADELQQIELIVTGKQKVLA